MIKFKGENNEVIDIVNEDDVVIGSRSRNEVHHAGIRHREVHVWLFDENYNVYFLKSPAHKSSAGKFDASIGGHPNVREDYIPAAVRETKEESGLSILPADLVLLTKFKGVSEHKDKGTINNFVRTVYIHRNPINPEKLTADPKETDGGFHKFSYEFLSTLSEKDKLLFHQFVPTHELPHVLEYLKK